MFSPELYTIRKFTFRQIVDADFYIKFNKQEERRYLIHQFDNHLFRQIRIITGQHNRNKNNYICFVDIKSAKSDKENLVRLIEDGFYINDFHYVLSERSASMTRQGILSFVDAEIEPELSERVSLGLNIKKTVLSKYVAYRGLTLSSCHCMEDWFPKMIVVPDYIQTIRNQKIKHLYDDEIEFENEEGEIIHWKQKNIKEDTMDLDINSFDGSGICHPEVMQELKFLLGLDDNETPSVVMLRLPFIKGLMFSMDYTSFYKENNVEYITDIWGEKYSVDEKMIIITESMYKGFKYFRNTNTIKDWENYWNLFHKYNYCYGIAKWNYTHETEPLYTRANYQILQDLDLPYEDFVMLAKDSIDWVERVMNGDNLYLYKFLGITKKSVKSALLENEAPYNKAILLNKDMAEEESIKKYIASHFRKYIDEMKCGKLYVKGSFKFLAPDLIMMMEFIGGLEPKGCLESNEFFSNNIYGNLIGEYLIERNPHLSRSEHVVLTGVENDRIKKYCSHFENICMINSKSLVPQRLNGADFDGDLVLVIDNKIMMKGVHRDIPFVIDTEDKITALEEEFTRKELTKLIMRTLNSLIGETSNCATCYYNKSPSSKEVEEKYLKYIDILSVINGKAIDFAKTGVVYNIPRYIAKYSKPLPYFMKYAGPYYANMKKLAKTRTNMNRLCWEIEKWEKATVKYVKRNPHFDHRIMMDEGIEIDENKLQRLEEIYINFSKEIKQFRDDQYKLRNYRKYKNWVRSNFPNLNNIDEAMYIRLDMSPIVHKYKDLCNEITQDIQELANLAVIICYEKYPSRSKSFIWNMAANGIIENLKKHPKYSVIPEVDLENGKQEYLGKRYNLVPYVDIIEEIKEENNAE